MVSRETYNSATFDIIVVGGGHAGGEAALVAARRGFTSHQTLALV